MANLVVKARGLEAEGITTHVYTGSYQVPVPTLNGKIKLRLRPNTQSGQVITLRGRGLPKRGKPTERGDLHVTIHAVLPKLNDDQRARLEPMLREVEQPNPRAGS